jgi:hypothetical protein
MTYAVPVVDLENVQLQAVRAGAQELGAVQGAWQVFSGTLLAENSGGRR